MQTAKECLPQERLSRRVRAGLHGAPAMRAGVGLAVLVLWGICPLAQGQELPPGFEPVPEQLLSGTTLTSPELNFSMQAPGEGWQWIQQAVPPTVSGQRVAGQRPQATSYSVYQSDSRTIFGVLAFSPAPRLTDATMRELMNGFKASRLRGGGREMASSYEKSAVPLPGSYRWRQTITGGNAGGAATVQYVGYALSAGKMYVIQYASTDAAQSQAFETCARSFRLLKKPAANAGAGLAGPGLGVVYFLLVLFLLAAGWIANRIAGRPAWNAAKLAAVVVLVLVVIRIFSAAPFDAPDAGRFVGRALGEGLIPLLLALYFNSRFEKQRAAAVAGSSATGPPPLPAAQAAGQPDADRLDTLWYAVIWGSVLVPFVGVWIIIILSSVMYYAWRKQYPKKANAVNRQGWFAWLVGNGLWLAVYNAMRSAS